jgi:arsenate reductase (thioredoxin)
VCDKAREECSVFCGATECLHWLFKDPASFIGVGKERLHAFRLLRDRVTIPIQAEFFVRDR